MISDNEKKIFERSWDLFKKYHDPKGDLDEHLDKMIRELGEFGQEYVGTEQEILAKGMIVTIADDFSKRHKRGTFK